MKTPTLTPQTLKNMLHDGGEIALIDVREEGQFGEGHLLFATPLPYSKLEIGIGALVPRKSARIVLCDDGEDGGGVADKAAKRLNAIGYSDVAVLAGGNEAWTKAGYAIFKGVNVPSKLFGEMVEHVYDTPRVTVTQLAQMKKDQEDFVIVDGRPYSEYSKMNIPGGICCPNAELPLRIRDIVKNPKTKIIVNCAGRTRSIMGAQTLLNFGIENPVYALENGTQGWVLADMELERGATRKYPEDINAAALPGLQASAKNLMARFKVPSVNAQQVQAWSGEANRSLYLLDVRTPEEFEAGSLPGAVHAPGGQLVQATDAWVGVRNARIVLLDHEGVRAPVVAAWLKQLGCDVYVLEGGVRAGLKLRVPEKAPRPALPTISAQDLKHALDANQCSAFYLGPSMNYRKQHVPGSLWSIRPRIDADAAGAKQVVLITRDATLAQLAAIDLHEAGIKDVKLLEGGLAAWTKAGYSLESSPDEPPDAECIDYLFFVHDRHLGNREAMRQYLAWETGLMAQLDAQDKASFKIGVPL
ncbi:MAG: sulfurtransferase [Betaproteobacteria bacterium]|nr:sulfurtransferase [Betaproteobacteria bacterium]